MTKTYSEQMQIALFRAAREIRSIAGQVLDDMQNDVELTHEATHIWARTTAKHYADKANALEVEAEEASYASARQEREQRASRDLYSTKIDQYEGRRLAAASRKDRGKATPV
jgi:hypothetical protein